MTATSRQCPTDQQVDTWVDNQGSYQINNQVDGGA